VQALAGPATRRVDLQGRCALPGMDLLNRLDQFTSDGVLQ